MKVYFVGRKVIKVKLQMCSLLGDGKGDQGKSEILVFARITSCFPCVIDKPPVIAEFFLHIASSRSVFLLLLIPTMAVLECRSLLCLTDQSYLVVLRAELQRFQAMLLAERAFFCSSSSGKSPDRFEIVDQTSSYPRTSTASVSRLRDNKNFFRDPSSAVMGTFNSSGRDIDL